MSILQSNRLFSSLVLALALVSSPLAVNYHIDTNAVNDSGNGTSPETAWRTLSRVQEATLNPGDSILLKRGCEWQGQLLIGASGVNGNPIVVAPYGTGKTPAIRNPFTGASNVTTYESFTYNAAILLSADYIVIDGLALHNPGCRSGVLLDSSSDYCTISNCEITGSAAGVYIKGRRHKVTRNTMRYLTMGMNTPGGDDDWGASAVILCRTLGNEISYNRMDSCFAFSYDYGEDGGAIEFWNTVDSCYIHHNFAYDTDGLLEIGGASGDSCRGNVMAYNVYHNTRGKVTSVFHNGGGKFGMAIKGFRFENNTMVCGANGMIRFDNPPSWGDFSFVNNIFLSLNGGSYFSGGTSFNHKNNIFHGAVSPGITLDASDISANPLFAGLSRSDFHLLPASPAIGAGQSLGHTLDFDNKPIPVQTPAIGAFEYDSAVLPVLYDWNFNTQGYTEGWIGWWQAATTASGGSMIVTVQGSDPIILSPDNLNLDADRYRYLNVVMKNHTADTLAHVYFINTEGEPWSGLKGVSYRINADSTAFMTYTIDMKTNANWTGTVFQIRLDPVQKATTGSTVSIDRIFFSTQLPTTTTQSLPLADLQRLVATPNPFNPSTTIHFSLPAATTARYILTDIRGTLIRSFDIHAANAKTGTLVWDGRDNQGRAVAAGIYMGSLVSDAGTLATHRLMLVK